MNPQARHITLKFSAKVKEFFNQNRQDLESFKQFYGIEEYKNLIQNFRNEIN